MQAFEDEGVLDHARMLGADVLGPGLAEIAERHPSVGEVRGLGAFWAIELVRDRETREPLVPFNAAGAGRRADEGGGRRPASSVGVVPFAAMNRLNVVPPVNTPVDDVEAGPGPHRRGPRPSPTPTSPPDTTRSFERLTIGYVDVRRSRFAASPRARTRSSRADGRQRRPTRRSVRAGCCAAPTMTGRRGAQAPTPHQECLVPLESNVDIAPATGKLGVLLPGMGAVGTTFIAGCLAIRKGLAKPIGSLTQMGTIRIGPAHRRQRAADQRLRPAGRARRPRVRRLGRVPRRRLRRRHPGRRARRAPARAARRRAAGHPADARRVRAGVRAATCTATT